MTFLLLLCLQDPLDPVTPPTRVDGAPLWLFAVDDGSERPAVSCERDQKLFVGRLDLKTLRAEWKPVASFRDVGGDHVADHWHVFAHGAHWLSFSAGRANKGMLLKLDRDFNRLGLWTVAENVERMPTNDHFLVAEPDGVAVGFFLPGKGHRIYRVDKEGRPRGQVEIGGGRYRHGNGSSALPLADGTLVLACDSIASVCESGISWMEFDREWKPRGLSRVLFEKRTNLTMASGVALADGTMIVHTRSWEGAAPLGERPSREPPKGSNGMGIDDGAIVRYAVSKELKVLSRAVIAEKDANRPHTALVGDLLLTTWDGPGGAKIRVDRVKK